MLNYLHIIYRLFTYKTLKGFLKWGYLKYIPIVKKNQFKQFKCTL